MNKKLFDLTKDQPQQFQSNRIRNTRQYVSAVMKSNFGAACIKKNNPFAIAFEKALNN